MIGLSAAAMAAVLHRQATAQTGGDNPAASWKSPELRLVRRITLGLNDEEVQRAKRLGYERYLDYQLNYTAIDDSAVEDYVSAHYPTLALEPAALYLLDSALLRTELIEATLYRSLYSKRQLYQRMVEFWTDHFNIHFNKVDGLKTVDDREVIRPHALGKFPDLLRASARSPAMLTYLDNVNSRGTNPNENYARELLELHTLGVDGGYTAQDVREVARCFTGWSRVYDRESPDRGKFLFRHSAHDKGEKVVLGHVIPANGGISDGETVLDILANHPSTARFIATKMARWLLRYDPPKELVERVAHTYTQTGGDIRAMIWKILDRYALIKAPAKYKRPYHLVVSALRATQPTIASFQSLRAQLGTLGHVPFNWIPPNGYPDSLSYWAGLILPRWNFATSLFSNQIRDVSVDLTPFRKPKTVRGVIALINTRFFGGEMPPREKAELTRYLSVDPTSEMRLRDTLALALAFPNFQWY